MMIVVALEDGTVKTHEGMIEVGADAHLRIIHGTTQAIQAVYAPGRWQWAEEAPEQKSQSVKMHLGGVVTH